jgi:hypothetical protein
MDENKSIAIPWLTNALVIQDMILLHHIVEMEYPDRH